MTDRLLKLQQDIYKYHNSGKYPFSLNYSPKLYFFPIGDMISIYYHGPGYDDNPSINAKELKGGYNFGFCALLDFLTEQENADKIISLVFDSYDEGANGVNDWNFERLTNSSVLFPNLEEFKVRLTNLGDHNTSSINYDSEDGTIANLVARMPKLQHLSVPSAPDQSFFDIEHKCLRSMVVQAGWDRQNFLENLSASNNFPVLCALDFAEVLNPFDDLTEDDYTSVETFKELFESKIFSNEEVSFHFKLRNSILTKEQLFEIQKINSRVQFLYINSQSGKYVNHMIKNDK